MKLLSPFRYPGGKTWLVDLICQWLCSIKPKPIQFVEPFAGGANVGLNVAYRNLANQVILIELDDNVAAVWRTIVSGDAEKLANRIASFQLTHDSVRSELAKPPRDDEDRAFQTILKNRVARAGILASGAGILKHGENGKGLKSRWYPDTLKKRILEVVKIRERIRFVKGDGLIALEQKARQERSVFFIDPPYTTGNRQTGKRLYTYHEIPHERLFEIASILAGDFLMTYNNDERIRKLAKKHNLDIREIVMRNSHHVRMTELLIGRDLTKLDPVISNKYSVDT